MIDQKLDKIKKENNLSALFITDPNTIFYLTGFRTHTPEYREAYVVFDTSIHLYVSGFYSEESKSVNSDIECVVGKVRPLFEMALDQLLLCEGDIGFEFYDLKHYEYDSLLKACPNKKIVPLKTQLSALRTIKTTEEIKNIAKAQEITKKALDEVVKLLEVGITEYEICLNIKKIMNSLGGNGIAFEPIVAFGQNSAKPHHTSNNTKLDVNSIVLIDCGARYNGYCGDYTRTTYFGTPTEKFIKIHSLVVEAQNEAIKVAVPNASCAEIFNVANIIFKRESLDSSFVHSLGHGLGVAIHEKPSFAPNSQDTLELNMVCTIEPGQYFSGWGGVRHEDVVLIADKPIVL